MQLPVDPSLLFNVVADRFLVPCPSDGVDVKAGGPEFPVPEQLQNLRVTVEEFSCCQTFDDTGDGCGGESGNGLEKEMHMVFICSDFHEENFVVLGYGPTDVFEGFFDGFREYFLPAFDGADKMVEEKGNIVGLPLMLSHAGMLLPE